MNTHPITVHVRMNSKIFRRFALYDTFRIHRKWVAPTVFAAILSVFAAVAFTVTANEQSVMIGSLLLIIGLGLPLVYLLHFLLQIHDQCKRLGLKTLRPAYTLILNDKELRVINDMKKEAEVSLPWSSLHGVWRGHSAYYIYAVPSRAFILPDGQYALSPAQMHAFFKEHMPDGRLHGKP